MSTSVRLLYSTVKKMLSRLSNRIAALCTQSINTLSILLVRWEETPLTTPTFILSITFNLVIGEVLIHYTLDLKVGHNALNKFPKFGIIAPTYHTLINLGMPDELQQYICNPQRWPSPNPVFLTAKPTFLPSLMFRLLWLLLYIQWDVAVGYYRLPFIISLLSRPGSVSVMSQLFNKYYRITIFNRRWKIKNNKISICSCSDMVWKCLAGAVVNMSRNN